MAGAERSIDDDSHPLPEVRSKIEPGVIPDAHGAVAIFPQG